jgi:antibiotic biosynthesis monooxygenase (ABM) superfamily enzyme
MAVHLAITRRVRPGREAEFERALREFFRASAGEGHQGALLLSPLPGSQSREYGILRSFASEEQRAAFYASPVFQAWEERVRALTEAPWQARELHGLETWFRVGGPPPRWKMAAVTYVGVYGTTLLLTFSLAPLMKGWPLLLGHGAFNLAVVGLLTWAVMPALTAWLRPWLHTART